MVARDHPVCLLIGALVGAWQGFWIAYVGIPAFIVTLAGMLIFRGLTLVVLGNQQIRRSPAKYRALGNGFLPDISGGTSALDRLTVILGVGATLALVIQAVKDRRIRQKFDLEVEPIGLVRHQARRSSPLLMLTVTFLLASYKGTPIVADRAGGPGARLHGPDEPHRLRPPHLRHRRQPARG